MTEQTGANYVRQSRDLLLLICRVANVHAH